MMTKKGFIEDYYIKEPASKMKIIDKVIPYRKNTYTGEDRPETRGVVIHHTACPNVPAINFWSYIQKESFKSYASYNALLDLDGTIWKIIPWEKRSFASGSYDYTPLGKNKFSSNASLYTVDMEICIRDNYEMTINQMEIASEWASEMCILFGLSPRTDIHRHMDIAKDKPECPIALGEDLVWKRFISMADRFYRQKKEMLK